MKELHLNLINYIAKNYDKAVIGDYTPTLDVANDKNMHRGMLNQSLIGMFRKILSWTMEKYNKICTVVDEKDTTKICCVCGYKENLEPTKKVLNKILKKGYFRFDKYILEGI